MAVTRFGVQKGKFKIGRIDKNKKVLKNSEEILNELKEEKKLKDTDYYRERSLAIHGWICARCAREYDPNTLHLLTVHHKDGNHDNNPPDGSNWENLCVYCHEDIHSRNILGDYLSNGDKENTPVFIDKKSDKEDSKPALTSMEKALLKALENKKSIKKD
ncbi:MAG: YajD family HNH nuclease [Thermodesulfobacteriota bacterium]|nr:YajD family HNH nuclease [Thermodesulfobacteriota bacterium]